MKEWQKLTIAIVTTREETDQPQASKGISDCLRDQWRESQSTAHFFHIKKKKLVEELELLFTVFLT